jgi:alkylated DNA repair dioxygenase AlkB
MSPTCSWCFFRKKSNNDNEWQRIGVQDLKTRVSWHKFDLNSNEMMQMELGNDTSTTQNLLPRDGNVRYYPNMFGHDVAERLFRGLMENIDWRHDEVVLFGKRIITRRMVAWYGDRDYAYTYSKTTKRALPWIPELLEIKSAIESTSGHTFNSCLLNLYHSGDEGMAWHSDDEKELLENGAIASVSLGSGRKFVFRHKTTKEQISVFLEHSSLLMMLDQTQKHWLHRLPTTKRVADPRINLTFRTIVG